MPRIDSAVADQMNADLAAKLANQTPTPGGEAAIRRLSEGMASGKPNYDEMSPMLAEAAKNQLPTSQPLISGLGALKSAHLPERLRPGTGSCTSPLMRKGRWHGGLGWVRTARS